jgi:hypothetical protein
MSSRLPERRATLWLGILIIALAFTLTLLVILRGLVVEEALGIILGAWLTGAMLTVVNFWFGTSVGGRMKDDTPPPPVPPTDEGEA